MILSYRVWCLRVAFLPAGVDKFMRQAALAGIKCYQNGSYVAMLFDTPKTQPEVATLIGVKHEDHLMLQLGDYKNCWPGSLHNLPVE